MYERKEKRKAIISDHNMIIMLIININDKKVEVIMIVIRIIITRAIRIIT